MDADKARAALEALLTEKAQADKQAQKPELRPMGALKDARWKQFMSPYKKYGR